MKPNLAARLYLATLDDLPDSDKPIELLDWQLELLNDIKSRTVKARLARRWSLPVVMLDTSNAHYAKTPLATPKRSD